MPAGVSALHRATPASTPRLPRVPPRGHVTLLEVRPDARDPDEAASMCTAGSEFLTEVLASFAMASSAFAGAQQQLQEAQQEVVSLRARLSAPGTGRPPTTP